MNKRDKKKRISIRNKNKRIMKKRNSMRINDSEINLNNIDTEINDRIQDLINNQANKKQNLSKKVIFSNSSILILLIFITIIVPILLNYLIPLTVFNTEMSKDAWLGFWGSFIGGIFTVIALWVTIRYTNQQNKINQELNDNENKKIKHWQLERIKVEIEKDRLDKKYIEEKKLIETIVKLLSFSEMNSKYKDMPNLYIEEFMQEFQYLLWRIENYEFKFDESELYTTFNKYSIEITKLLQMYGSANTGKANNLNNDDLVVLFNKFKSVDFDLTKLDVGLKVLQKSTSSINIDDVIFKSFDFLSNLIELKAKYHTKLMYSSSIYLKSKREVLEKQKDELMISLTKLI